MAIVQPLHRFSALASRDFRLLWVGLLISNIGSQMQIVALNWHIYLLTNSAIALGTIGFSRFLPILLFSLLGGNAADVINRKKLQLCTQALLTILSSILALTTTYATITPLLIYIVTGLAALALSFDMPARQALIPSLVPKKHLSNAMSLNVIMFQTSMIIGPALGGIVIAKAGVGAVYAINALSFLAVITALLCMKTTGAIEHTGNTISFSSIREGIQFVRSNTIIWSTMLLDFFSTFFSSATSLLPIFAKDILHVGPEGLGLLYAAPSVGAVITGFVLAHRGVGKKPGGMLLAAVSVYGIGTVLFGISSHFFLSLLALFILGVGDSISKIIRNVIRQLATPDYIRGRMIGVNMIFVMGGPQLGEFEAGMLAALIGAPFSVVIGGACTLAFATVLALRVRTLREYVLPLEERQAFSQKK